MKLLSLLCFAIFIFSLSGLCNNNWSTEKAARWYEQQGWIVGSNFVPSSASNQLEMWQAATFDTATINRELLWAADIGFNTMRVFLHNLLWEQDSTAYLKRIETYLSISQRHGISTMLVLFDGVWDPYPKLGKQNEPRPFVHNSRWVQSPGAGYLNDTVKWNSLKSYVTGIMRHFSNDERIIIWDIYNEVDNPNYAYRKTEIKDKKGKVFVLLKKSFQWARAINPSQPLTACVWHHQYTPKKANEINQYILGNSDIITFHSYDNLRDFKKRVAELKPYEKPIVCTEYLARKKGSTIESILPFMKEQHIGAYNWGLVSGRSQTIYPWKSWVFKKSKEPEPWFHDLFRENGKPYSKDEVELIKKLMGVD